MVAPGGVGEVDLGARQELFNEHSPHLQASCPGEGLESGHAFLHTALGFTSYYDWLPSKLSLSLLLLV